MSDSQTPTQEFRERAAEQAAAFLTVPHLSALQNLRALWADARARVADSHKAQMASLGVEASQPEDMGDIGISGDHTVTNYYQNKEGWGAKLLPLVLAAGVGLAAPYVWEWCKQPTPETPTAPASGVDYGLKLEVKDTP